MSRKLSSVFVFIVFTTALELIAQSIPLPEHPRPDLQRPLWRNLNGSWEFAFDSLGIGIEESWHLGDQTFAAKINVPFPWGSKLSGVEDLSDIGWYQKEITIDETWADQRIFLTIGASDWETTVWFDGILVGKHQGGYVPFSFELTEHIRFDSRQKLVVRVDDKRRDFTLYGKQGYGNARGIWQTIYLEGRGSHFLDAIHFTPDIDNEMVEVTAYLPEIAMEDLPLEINITTANSRISHQATLVAGQHKIVTKIALPKPHLWSLDDPFLYEVSTNLAGDELNTYFGMRKISVVDLPGTDYRYIALNNEPIYMQLALDQSYHAEGYYTFPNDQFIIDEINRSKSIGLNGIRTHIKVEVPRKLYWADKLGLLVMEDLPNSWGEPDAYMQKESEYTLRQMIKRDYNHPSIFSWVDFNETWGLRTKKLVQGEEKRLYLPETQHWVASMYYLTKALDPTRLAEDNSICCGAGHVETDINSWHAYLPGWAWEAHLKEMSENIYPGSTFDFEDGFEQGNQPNINSECGNVWGYDGSTGDVDWSYDYHRMMNTFRKYPKIAGWLYTEHHDVINEWNGYWRFDRTEKETGFGEIVNGMTLNDMHSAVYLSTGNEITYTVAAGTSLDIPLYLSVMTGADLGAEVEISYQIKLTNLRGEENIAVGEEQKVAYVPWMQKVLDPLTLQVPSTPGLAIVQLFVKDENGHTLHHNFITLEITSSAKDPQVIQVDPKDFSDAKWSKKQWSVMEGLKINGAGSGYFEYQIPISGDTKINGVKSSYFMVEISAKELFVKDQQDFDRDQNYMTGSRVSPSGNPNSYPMTDELFFPSQISIWIEGDKSYETLLADDPADHRGVLSWHHQLKDRKLREAGSYGYLVKVPISKSTLRQAQKKGFLEVRIQADDEGGVAIYGKQFGRYPIDPCLVLR